MSKHQPPITVNIGPLLDAPVPHDYPSEVAVIGSLMLDPGVLADVTGEGLTPNMFYTPKLQTIYMAIVALVADDVPIDVVGITRKLSDRGVLDQVGGVDYLIECFESVPTSASAGYYASLVVESYNKRRVIEAAGKMLHRAYKTDDSSTDQAWTAHAELEEIASGHKARDVTMRKEAIGQAMTELMNKRENGYITGVRTGFHEVDEVLGGMSPGNLYLIAARPAMGKTAISLQVAQQVARAGTPVMFSSIEMPTVQVASRDIAYRAGLTLEHIRQPSMMSDNDWQQLCETSQLDDGELIIQDAAGMQISQIESTAKRMKSQHNIGMVLIDYLQLMSYPQGMSKYEGVGYNAKACKQMARRLDLPVVLLSQLSRLSERRDSKRPMMSDVRDSGEVEEACDAIMLLHRDDYYLLQEKPDAEPDRKAAVIIAKNRHGPAGVVELRFAGGAFSNLVTGAY